MKEREVLNMMRLLLCILFIIVLIGSGTWLLALGALGALLMLIEAYWWVLWVLGGIGAFVLVVIGLFKMIFNK